MSLASLMLNKYFKVNSMQCLYCGAHAMQRDTRDITIDGITVEAVTGDYCTACGEVIFDRVEGDRYSRLRLAALGGKAPDMADIPRRHGS